MQGSFGKKPLFSIYDEILINMIKGIGKFTQHTRLFMETIKVIMKQEGLVMKAELKTEITVAKTPVNFLESK
jgi:hypothetical protein